MPILNEFSSGMNYIGSAAYKKEGGDKKLWGLIMKGTEKNYPMTTSLNWYNNPTTKYPNPEYLEKGTYTILKGVQFKTSDGKDGP